MSVINMAPKLKAMFDALDSRIRKLELSQIFTAPAISADPSPLRNGMIWYRNSDNTYRAVTDGVAGPLPVRYFAGFYDSSSQTLAVANTVQQVVIGSSAYGSGISLVSNKLQHLHAGTYIFSYSVTFTNTDTTVRYANVFVKFNGSTIAGTNMQVAVPSSHGGTPGNITLNNASGFIVPISVNDTVELWWTADSTQVSISYLPAVGSVPASDSVLITSRQIM